MLDVVKSAFKKLDSYSDKFLVGYLVLNVVWIFICMILYFYTKCNYMNVSTSYVLLFILNLFVIGYFGIRKLVKFDKIDVFLILLVFFGIISTIFSKDINVSLYGYKDRYEGLFQLLYYYSLMYLGSIVFKDKSKKIIIGFILFFGGVNAFASIIQVFDILKFILLPFRGFRFAYGLVTHPNFFGSYMTLCLSLCIGLFLYSKDGKVKTCLRLLLCGLFYTGLSLGNALSSAVGLICVLLLVVIYFIYLICKKEITKFLIVKHILLVVCLVCVNVFLSCSNKTVLNDDVVKLTGEVSEVVKGNVDDSFGTGRMFAWKQTLKVVPNHLLHGVGVDSFVNAFEHPIYIEHKTSVELFDKAHNEYLQKLICEGLFSCVTYISMLFILFVGSIKKILKNKNYITMGLFLSFVGYSIQAFFNISVIEVAPLFWIVIGLLYDRKCKNLQN